MLTTTDHDRGSAGLTYVYPVISRRSGGLSIGINLNPNNACNWRCIYCQLHALFGLRLIPVDKQQYGSATGSIATMRILGQMMSMALVTLIFAVVIGQVKIEPANFLNLQQAISICFFISASLCIPGFIFSLVRGRMHQSVATK